MKWADYWFFTRERLLKRVEELAASSEPDALSKLETLLESSFPAVKNKHIRPVVMATMKHLPVVKEEYLKQLLEDKVKLLFVINYIMFIVFMPIRYWAFTCFKYIRKINSHLFLSKNLQNIFTEGIFHFISIFPYSSDDLTCMIKNL